MPESRLQQLAFPPHVREALGEGKLWRAKEILQGRVGSMPYSPELYEQYGVVLLAMQDEMQGGKYLFLSGARRDEYALSIAMFLERHGRRRQRDLIASFPANARALPLGKFPVVVRAELVARGVRDRAELPLDAPQRRLSKILGAAAVAGCLLLAALGAASMVVGLPIVLRAIVSALR